jgi:hypothetical protein
MPFQIIDCETGRPLCELIPLERRLHDTGDEAQAYARTLSQRHSGRKFRVKKVLDNRWKDREREKFDSGEYQHVPWVNENWWANCNSIHKDHFPHASYKEPGKLAYTESPEKGMDNLHTQIKPGRYLETYFGDKLRAWGYDVKELALQFARQHEPRILRFADTEDEVQYVYEHGPSSCMSSERYRYDHGWGHPTKGKWPKDIHACRMYINGDLQVAYIVDDDKAFDQRRTSATIIARSLVWPAKKTHSRVYGDEARMRGLMSAAGYKFGPPIGAKLQRIPITDDNMLRFIVPYIDAGLRSGEGSLSVFDKKDHLEVTNERRNSHGAGSTTGVCSPKIDRNGRQHEGSSHCDHCDNEECDCERVYYGTTNADNGNISFIYMCDDCRDDGGVFWCDHDNRFYSSNVTAVTMANGSTWSQRAFSSAGFICQGNGGRYARNERVALPDGTLWSIGYFHEHGFICDAMGGAHPNSDLILMENGQKWSKEGFANYGFHCPKCNKNLHKVECYKDPDGDTFVCKRCHPATKDKWKKRDAQAAKELKKLEAKQVKADAEAQVQMDAAVQALMQPVTVQAAAPRPIPVAPPTDWSVIARGYVSYAPVAMAPVHDEAEIQAVMPVGNRIHRYIDETPPTEVSAQQARMSRSGAPVTLEDAPLSPEYDLFDDNDEPVDPED